MSAGLENAALMPSRRRGQFIYYRLVRDNLVNVSLSLVRGPTGSVAVGSEDTFTPATNQLVVPAVTVGNATYYNVIVTVNQLTSIGSVAGADTFDGTNLVLRNVQVGTQWYHDVTLHVALSNVARVGGGMPGCRSISTTPAPDS